MRKIIGQLARLAIFCAPTVLAAVSCHSSKVIGRTVGDLKNLLKTVKNLSSDPEACRIRIVPLNVSRDDEALFGEHSAER